MTALAAVRRSRQVRGLAVSTSLGALLFAAFCVTLSIGDFPIPVDDVLRALFGQGDRATEFIVNQLRLPRALTGVLVGAAFGISGAIFQSVARNPLASPDIIGITYGASAAAVFAIVVLEVSGPAVALIALAGALLTALAIYALAWRQGVSSYRLILIGIGIGSIAVSVTSFLLTRARVETAQQALVWMTGSLNGRDWQQVRYVAVALGLVLPILVVLARRLNVLQLGDDTAYGLGLRVEPARLALVVLAVVLAAVATAAAGPVGFVAFVAPAVARRLTRSPGPALVASGLAGALLVCLADLVARPYQLPVGVVTGAIGAPYLIFLLARTNRLGSGG